MIAAITTINELGLKLKKDILAQNRQAHREFLASGRLVFFRIGLVSGGGGASGG
jgi:hypothetical protein